MRGVGRDKRYKQPTRRRRDRSNSFSTKAFPLNSLPLNKVTGYCYSDFVSNGMVPLALRSVCQSCQLPVTFGALRPEIKVLSTRYHSFEQPSPSAILAYRGIVKSFESLMMEVCKCSSKFAFSAAIYWYSILKYRMILGQLASFPITPVCCDQKPSVISRIRLKRLA